MSPPQLTVAVIGAGGKMGMRVSFNLEHGPYSVFYSETNPAARGRLLEAGRHVSDAHAAVSQSDVVILAVPDVLLREVSSDIVPLAKTGTIVLTLDPAAAYAGLVSRRDDVHLAVAHPCHPSVFLERKTPEEWADTFGGVAAAQDVVAALNTGDGALRQRTEEIIRAIYAPVHDVHWVTVKQLAVLEPTLTETITCMLSAFLKDVLTETVHTAGVPEPAARAMLLGHIQVALTNSLRGSNPFSDAALIAMDYGRQAVIRDDWKRIFDDAELDKVIARMLHIEAVRHPASFSTDGKDLL